MEQSTKRILLVDDEEKFLDAIGKRMKLMGLTALKASSGPESIELARKNRIELAIVDLNMPDMDGLVTIARLKEIQPGIRTVLLTGYGNEKVKQAAEALHAAYFEKDNMGAFWNFVKQINPRNGVIVIPPPPHAAESFRQPLDRSGKIRPDEREIPDAGNFSANFPHPLEIAASGDEYYHLEPPRLIGETPAMQELKKNIAAAAVLDSPVLFRGETGTGKELAARAIHSRSRRKNNGFVAVNCGSFSRKLLAHEIWGREKAPFTATASIKTGLIEANPGSSILLNDIEKLPPNMQDQLLRLLREKVVTRVGGTEEIPVDIRVMVATTENLMKKVNEGNISEDLYRRLNIFELDIPPLRERRDDIAPLCSYFLNRFDKEYGKDIKYISDEVMSIFMSHPFPGNVRELENLIERAVILADHEKIERRHLPGRFQKADLSGRQQLRKFVTLAELEAQYIIEVLEATGGNKTKAVEVLGISRAALWRKLKQLKENK